MKIDRPRIYIARAHRPVCSDLLLDVETPADPESDLIEIVRAETGKAGAEDVFEEVGLSTGQRIVALRTGDDLESRTRAITAAFLESLMYSTGDSLWVSPLKEDERSVNIEAIWLAAIEGLAAATTNLRAPDVTVFSARKMATDADLRAIYDAAVERLSGFQIEFLEDGETAPDAEYDLADDIERMQEALREQGRLDGPADGVLGPQTIAALRSVERREGEDSDAALARALPFLGRQVVRVLSDQVGSDDAAEFADWTDQALSERRDRFFEALSAGANPNMDAEAGASLASLDAELRRRNLKALGDVVASRAAPEAQRKPWLDVELPEEMAEQISKMGGHPDMGMIVEGLQKDIWDQQQAAARAAAESEEASEDAPAQATGDADDAPKIDPDETAPFQSDRPARTAAEDLLNRKGVADALGTIIDRVWTTELSTLTDAEDRSFVIHLHGPWGSGKSSILGFLRENLLSGRIAKPAPGDPWLEARRDPPWVVVDFNAWRAQGRGPAWWALIETVYRDTIAQLEARDPRAARRVGFRHWWWRVRSGMRPALVGVVLTIVALLAVAWFGDVFGAWLAGAIPLVSFLVGGVAFRLAPNLANTEQAEAYNRLARDPVGPLSARYVQLVADAGRPVAVFIDDLDRCEPTYVVELLQTVQTLFRRARVAYVVAGDRGWICRSFELGYKEFAETHEEPGYTLGHLFLEKIFQISVEVPPLTPDLRAAYWSRLLERGEDEAESAEERTRAAEDALSDAKTEAEVRSVARAFATTPRRAAAISAVAMRRMHSDEIRREQEHFLTRYADLLEPNPRAMKRLLNAYGFRRGYDVLGESDPDALARWTILEMRWPLLAAHLRTGGPRKPAAKDRDDPDRPLRDLAADPEVRAVAGKLEWSQLSHLAPRGALGKVLPA